MKCRLLLVGLLVVLILDCAGCAARGPLAGKSPDERYAIVSERLDSLVTGGRLSRIVWADDGSSVEYTRNESRYRFDFNSRRESEIAMAEEAPPTQPTTRPSRSRQPARGRQRDRTTSPDGKWIAMCKDWNVIIEPAPPPSGDVEAEDENEHDAEHATSEPEDAAASQPQTIHVTSDGHRKFRYGTASWVYGEELDQRDAMWWSPDSRRLVFYEFDEREVPDHFIADDLTKLHTTVLTEGYPKPGEPNPVANLLVYDMESQQTMRIQPPMDEGEWYTYGVQFAPGGDSPPLLFFRTNRRQNVLHLMAADISTGETRIVLTETQETWQDNSPPMKFLGDGHRFIWTTEKTGWKQLELRDLDGSIIATLTRSQYPVSSILKIDEEAGWVYYTAYSDQAGCPLNAHLHRVHLDGSDQARLTRESLNHSITMSPDGKWFITEHQAVDVPPKTVLYDTQGNRIATLARSDLSQFKKMNMQMPELFTFKADDGRTDLYGVLYKPSNFMPSKRYPLLIDVYGGPMSQSVRNRFSAGNAECEYGVLIAEIDNRGTANRGKAFEAATYMRLGDVDIKDQVDGVRYLAKRTYVDKNRVGIMGHSYGGYMAALAVLKYPDVFHVACAGGTVTDWRNYDSIYTERFMRMPQENEAGYDAGSCLKYVSQFKGKLMLLHGMVDDNVHTNNAWQLIDALQKAGKRFEMMLYPNAGHSLGARANSARWDFLRRNLIGDRDVQSMSSAARSSH